MGRLLRAFGRGRHTARQLEYASAGRAVFAQQHVPIVARVRDFLIPGQVARGKRVLLAGSVLLTPEIVSASLGPRMLLVWLPWGSVPDDSQGAVALRPDGLHVTYEVARIVPHGRGEISFHYRFTPPAHVNEALAGTTAPLSIEAGAFAELCWSALA
ncbi:hypothetical protein ACFXP7_02720 [Microbacterium sp. P06]|uniref:hypothetical protein n=1 Tax=Microbacterium sp. P06 TaxID=3366949 RepID=UPI00374592F7